MLDEVQTQQVRATVSRTTAMAAVTKHDFTNSLHAVLSLLELLQKFKPADPAQVDSILARMEVSANELEKIFMLFLKENHDAFQDILARIEPLSAAPQNQSSVEPSR